MASQSARCALLGHLEHVHRQASLLLLDSPDRSVHHSGESFESSLSLIVQMGNSEGKEIGQWFWSEYDCSSSPVIPQIANSFFSRTTSRSRRIASNEFDKQVNVHVAMDNTLVLSEIRQCCLRVLSLYSSLETAGALCQIPSKVRPGAKKCTETPNGWKPLVIIIPLRLGLTEVNTEYIDQLKV